MGDEGSRSHGAAATGAAARHRLSCRSGGGVACVGESMEHALRSDGSTLSSQLDLTQWPTEIAPGRSTRYAADGGATPHGAGVPGRAPMQAKPGGGGLRIGG